MNGVDVILGEFDRYMNGNTDVVPPDAPARTRTTTTQDT